jgi:hypothetical protein
MKHNYGENRQRRIDAAKDRAASQEAAADTHFQVADAIARHILPGQPILIGYHSEKSHPKDRKRIGGAMSKARTALEMAKYYRDLARATESNTAISSDDRQAIPKLTEKLEKLIAIQVFMKAANKFIRQKNKVAFLLLDYGTEQLWETLNTPDCGRVGFPKYKLTNNNANIRRIRQRIQDLQKAAGRVTSEEIVKGVRIIQNVEANRLQLVFTCKPSKEVREKLHRQHSFHWYVKDMAWQRFLNPQSIHEAKVFLEWYDPSK